MEATSQYRPQDLENDLERFDEYLGRQSDFGMFESEATFRMALLGSAYIVTHGIPYQVKDIDLYTDNSKFFENLRRCPDAVPAETSSRVLHVNLTETDSPTIEVFESLGDPLDFTSRESREVDRRIREVLESPPEYFYTGENLEVVRPAPEDFAITKDPGTEESQKYRNQLEAIDEVSDTDLVEGFISQMEKN